MKEGEIAAVLGIAEKTVSVHLHRYAASRSCSLGRIIRLTMTPPEGASP